MRTAYRNWWGLAHLQGVDAAGTPQRGGGTIRSIEIDDLDNITNDLRSP